MILLYLSTNCSESMTRRSSLKRKNELYSCSLYYGADAEQLEDRKVDERTRHSFRSKSGRPSISVVFLTGRSRTGHAPSERWRDPFSRLRPTCPIGRPTFAWGRRESEMESLLLCPDSTILCPAKDNFNVPLEDETVSS